MNSKAAKQELAPVDGPAKATVMHRQDRELTDEATGRQIIGKTGIRVETQWQRVVRLAQMVCKDAITDKRTEDLEINRALDRRDAGNAFVTAWDISTRGTKDSTDMSRGGSASSADGMTQARIDAAKLLAGWQAHMGPNDWMLVRRVCGENYTVAQAVGEISPGYVKASLARFREAADALIAGQAAAGRCEWCRRNKPHGANLNG